MLEAIGTYLKLVDVLLVMADATPNYPYWVKCTTSAETYQKKIKTLIALSFTETRKDSDLKSLVLKLLRKV